jgi:hypothetical protein
VGVKALTFESDEDVSLCDAPRVSADLSDELLAVSLEEAAASKFGEGLEADRAHGGRGIE